MVVLARSVLLVILAFACASTDAVAQQKFPNGTVRIVAPYVPGGAVDIAARTLADLLSERWGSPVIVENRTGAATAIGTNAVATANPDGHTLLLTATPFLVNPTLQPTLPYDTLRDFAGISMVVEQPVALVAIHPFGRTRFASWSPTPRRTIKPWPMGRQGSAEYLTCSAKCLRERRASSCCTFRTGAAPGPPSISWPATFRCCSIPASPPRARWMPAN